MEIKKTTNTKTFIELFDIILTGNKEDSRKAAREVRRLLYSSRNEGKYDDIKIIIENAPSEYSNIKEYWREENFVMAVSVLYFLHNRENQQDFLFPWFFHLLQHQNGNIRQSAVRMIENELGPLTVYIRCQEYKADNSNDIKAEQADFMLLNLFINLNNLLANLWKPEYRKYKHVDSLPTGPCKSIQMVLNRMEEYCGKIYMKRLKSQFV